MIDFSVYLTLDTLSWLADRIIELKGEQNECEEKKGGAKISGFNQQNCRLLSFLSQGDTLWATVQLNGDEDDQETLEVDVSTLKMMKNGKLSMGLLSSELVGGSRPHTLVNSSKGSWKNGTI